MAVQLYSLLLATTGSMIRGYASKTSPHLAEKFTGKNLTSTNLATRYLKAQPIRALRFVLIVRGPCSSHQHTELTKTRGTIPT